MKICWMYGCELRATRPMAAPSMGVSRQPSTVSPSSRTMRSMTPSHCSRALRLHRQEGHAHAVLARGRQGEAELGALAREELVRDLDQHAGAVAGFRIAAAGAAMRQVDQDLNALDDDVVRFLALDVGDEADSAGIVFVARVVKTLRRR